MTKLKLLGAAALVASSALASPVLAQAINNPGRCSPLDPNCQNLGAGNSYTDNYQHRAAYRTPRDHVRREARRNENMRYGDMRYGRNDASWHADSTTDPYHARQDTNPFYWPGDVATGVVGGAAATAGAAVNTAGAIATAPFRNENAYAYYNGDYNTGYYDSAWNNWDRRTYAQRNGFVCEPGTWFKGGDGRQHPCQ